LGYDNQRLGKHFHVVAYYVPPAYDPRKSLESIASAWAFLQISSDPKPETAALPVAREVNPVVEIPVMTAGYSKRTPHKMTGDKECRIVGGAFEDTVIFGSCSPAPRFSGGAV